jgi:hypothetical protein
VVGFLASQLGTLRDFRTPAGHGEDIRPALAAANRTEYAGLPIVVTPPNNAPEIAAYARSVEQRLAGVHLQRDLPSIWPQVDPPSKRKQYLRQHARVVLLLKAPSKGECAWSPRRSPETYVSRCLPAPLREMPYQVESAEAAGREWTFAVLAYHPPVKSDP